VEPGDRRGLFFALSPEIEALARWQRGGFLAIERDFARVEEGTSGIDFEQVYKKYRCSLGA
jgi:hypothetical protein